MRDEGLEQVLRDHLADERGLTEKAMFGGRCWLLHGHLLCGARHDGALIRLGAGNDGWALKTKGIGPLKAGEREIAGWVRVSPEAFGNDALATKLLTAALEIVKALPPKTIAPPPKKRSVSKTTKKKGRT